MTIDFDTLNHVKQLRRVDLRPPEKLVQQILRSGENALTPLLELATSVDLLDEDPPDCYGPIHAVRLLGELRSLQMIEPLIRVFDPYLIEAEANTPPSIWSDDVPQMIGRIGEPAVAPLRALADDPTLTIDQRAAVLQALACTIGADESLRPAIIAELRERLAASEDRALNAHIVMALSTARAQEAYSEVMARYRAGMIETDIAPAATVRQLLYTSQRLKCVVHPFFERYESHGPVPPQLEA